MFRRLHKRFSTSGSHRARARSARQWLALTLNSTTTVGVGVTKFELLAFEAPTVTVGTPLTADPPEDQTLDRVISFQTITQTAAGIWDIGLILADRTWTPVGTTSIVPDLDKRWLWWRSGNIGIAGDLWTPMTWKSGAGPTYPNAVPAERDVSSFDIAPKVKLEDGKALMLVVYQATGGEQLTMLSNFRILMHRAGRR